MTIETTRGTLAWQTHYAEKHAAWGAYEAACRAAEAECEKKIEHLGARYEAQLKVAREKLTVTLQTLKTEEADHALPID